MYMLTSLRGAKMCKIGKKGVFLVTLTHFGEDMTDKLRKNAYLGSVFIPEKYMFRVCFQSPFTRMISSLKYKWPPWGWEWCKRLTMPHLYTCTNKTCSAAFKDRLHFDRATQWYNYVSLWVSQHKSGQSISKSTVLMLHWKEIEWWILLLHFLFVHKPISCYICIPRHILVSYIWDMDNGNLDSSFLSSHISPNWWITDVHSHHTIPASWISVCKGNTNWFKSGILYITYSNHLIILKL